MELEKILFPVDLTEASEEIAEYVKDMADKFNAEVHVIFSVHIVDCGGCVDIACPYMGQFEPEVVKGAEQRLLEFSNKHFSNYRCSARVLIGNPAEVILKYIEENSIDLIIMGTHGRRGLGQIIFGSVANQVVKRSPVPVLTVHPYTKPQNEQSRVDAREAFSEVSA